VAGLPEVGDAAPDIAPLGRVEGPAVVTFLRHVGCPFAEATMRALSEEAERCPQVAWVAISHARLEATDRWCAAVAASRHVRVVIDEERSAYAGWGLGRSNLGHFMGRRSLRAVARLARTGIRNRHPVGTRWQRAGTFAVDARGTIVWRHIPAHAGELPDLADALATLGARATSGA
jgi:alkyl-hydroperoxide reductase/thiol specific antioxidant family protein